MCCRRAHPRVCGENPTMVAWRLPAAGSSPRVRGKPGFLRPLLPEGGLIPACAGKTRRARALRHRPPAHPRVCGENDDAHVSQGVGVGSSPRVRGKPRLRPGIRLVDRLIPACAGKTRRPGGRRSGVSAHPRVCGENPWTAYGAASPRGSSPRVRGKPCSSCQSLRQSRLIPACAGKTASCVAIE